ncbi:dTDP-4-amino-4,6-dideoxygalactose transaminase [Raineya orbicola]|jgi:dTDP-4-amino-4,6-dideoxygalactose transaminase|uniref:TDP-4-keto-6-deoxy-D-glucose transaminase n=1 Tax=Raineya orbicola TaxID=2016530 RepID=A0A2N3I8R9_9BACT|nr:dTDP-4-amino-4,6-dideoxygalactose transaminase [Raineya orbicola]PKQ66744.1 TDP-4-keto-6-deoxy-D-glucose transaminase [Raineya orbicola]
MQKIPFNKPYFTGKETEYIRQAVENEHISGDGFFTQKCHQFFQNRYSFQKCLLTTSCTDALEMSAILLNIQEGDEVIAPSYTFVSTVNAFVLRGAKIVFADTYASHPNINPDEIEALISPKTKAIIVVHYAGVACDMEKILSIAQKYNLWVVEDAAQAIDSYYKNVPLGSLGHLSAFSFHETKNIISGEGGMLVINDDKFAKRAEIIREKGTNRSAFFRGEVDKYGWVDIGSSFLPSDIIAAFLYAQLENLDNIQARRKEIWNIYYEGLYDLAQKGKIQLPYLPKYASNNAHLFYVVCESLEERSALLAQLKNQGIGAVFHYLSLHKSSFYSSRHDGRVLPHTDKFADCLLRLPFYYEITPKAQEKIIMEIRKFYNS